VAEWNDAGSDGVTRVFRDEPGRRSDTDVTQGDGVTRCRGVTRGDGGM